MKQRTLTHVQSNNMGISNIATAAPLLLLLVVTVATKDIENEEKKVYSYLNKMIRDLQSRSDSNVEKLAEKIAVYKAKSLSTAGKLSSRMDAVMKATPNRESKPKERVPELDNLAAVDNNSSFLAVSSTGTQSYANNGIVKFTTLRHNDAPATYGFDRNAGHYRCPYDGYYMFFVDLSGSSAAYHQYTLWKESSVQTVAYTYSSGGYKSLSALTITYCGRGEDVWVANTYGSSRTIYSPTSGVNHFTGARIY